MILAPKFPPGRANRKVLAFRTEIIRLRGLGYSFEAIRQVLNEAGITVSCSTLKREVCARRAYTQHGLARPQIQPNLVHTESHGMPFSLQAEQGAVSLQSIYSSDGRTGKEIAEDFMKSRITNPLLQERSPK